MKQLLLVIVVLLVGGGLYVASTGGFEGIEKKIEEAQTKMAQAQGEDAFDTLLSNAEKNHPDAEIKSEAIQKEAQKMMDDTLAQAQDGDEKEQTAASIFFGFWILNTHTRPQFCEAQGVELSNFLTLFKTSHAQEHTSATRIMEKAGYTEERFKVELGPQLDKMIVIDMNDIAKLVGGDHKAACQTLNDSASEIVPRMLFKLRAADAANILLNAQ